MMNENSTVDIVPNVNTTSLNSVNEISNTPNNSNAPNTPNDEPERSNNNKDMSPEELQSHLEDLAIKSLQNDQKYPGDEYSFLELVNKAKKDQEKAWPELCVSPANEHFVRAKNLCRGKLIMLEDVEVKTEEDKKRFGNKPRAKVGLYPIFSAVFDNPMLMRAHDAHKLVEVSDNLSELLDIKSNLPENANLQFAGKQIIVDHDFTFKILMNNCDVKFVYEDGTLAAMDICVDSLVGRERQIKWADMMAFRRYTDLLEACKRHIATVAEPKAKAIYEKEHSHAKLDKFKKEEEKNEKVKTTTTQTNTTTSNGDKEEEEQH